jgi:cytidylate kinase
MTDALVVAIDGPAGAGKSTVGRAVAEHLRLEVLDTGSMYRAITALALRAGVDPHDEEKVTLLARESTVEVGARVTCEGVDLTDELRSDGVNAAVSVVAAHPGVRDALVAAQREWIDAHHGGVVEGRDIGTVVAPDAQVKVFLTATEDVRASRRSDEHAASLERRDRLDEGRAASPLRPAADAHIVDTSHRAVADVVAEVLALL